MAITLQGPGFPLRIITAGVVRAIVYYNEFTAMASL
jgi:hypothetical protein